VTYFLPDEAEELCKHALNFVTHIQLGRLPEEQHGKASDKFKKLGELKPRVFFDVAHLFHMQLFRV
jgi:hypothetical protein